MLSLLYVWKYIHESFTQQSPFYAFVGKKQNMSATVVWRYNGFYHWILEITLSLF